MARALRPSADEARGYNLVQLDSVFVGIVAAAGTFLPVFLVRLGASGTAVGLLTAIPAFCAFTLAIPFGRWLQGRRNIVPSYSRLRLAGWLGYGMMALASAVLPTNLAVPVILGIWAAASLPAAAGQVAFPIVMDGAAGLHSRFDLLGRRWAISGVVTSISIVVAGQALAILPFPTNFEWLFVVISIAAVGSFMVSRRIVVPNQEPADHRASSSARARVRAPVDLVRANRSFVRFELRSLAYTATTGLAMPLLPLFYVQELRAPNGWIGIIGASQSVGAVIGYLVVRRLSRHQSAASILLPALLATAAVPATLALISSLPAVAVAAFVGGLAAAAAQLALFDELMRRIPRQYGVTFTSVDQSLQNLALIVAPTLGGFLGVAIGVRTGLVVTAAVALGAFALFLLDWRRRRGVRRQGLIAESETNGPPNAFAPVDGATGST